MLKNCLSTAFFYICTNEPVKTRYFIFLQYKGTSYHGWQLQPNSITVQQVIDEALTTMLSEKIATTGAGRTDTGVHAAFFCAHFDSDNPDLAVNKKFLFRLNRFLPKDISATRISRVIPDANARFSAVSRTYKYYISLSKDPFSQDSSWHMHGDPDIQAMNKAAQRLLEVRDFTSFARLHSDTTTNDCRIFHAEWKTEENMLVFTIKADRFLRNMVRAIVGTLIDVGFGKLSIDQFNEVIEAKDRCKAGKSAPAKGLFLTEIEYPDNLFLI